jgi:hypothetical protein
MAINGIGGNGSGGSPLDQFQKLRDAAQKKLEGSDRQAGLAELIQRKQRQLGGNGTGALAPEAVKSQAERIPPGPAAPGNAAAAAGNPATPSAAYGRAGGARPQDAAPRLGRFVDFLA